MQMFFCAVLCVALAVSVLWERATDVRRLSASAYPEIPKHVSDWLTKQGCSIPQAELSAKYPMPPNNVISGEFAAKGQKDWAALCSRDGSSAIVVLWGGDSRCDAVLADRADSLSMQKEADGSQIYSRMVSPIGKEQILKRKEAFGSSVPSPLSHEGIDDAFVGKGSVTYYCHKGKWLKMQGAD